MIGPERAERIAALLGPYAVAILPVAGFVFMVSYAVMMKHVLLNWPIWASAPTVICHIITVFAMSTLHDRQNQHQQPKDR